MKALRVKIALNNRAVLVVPRSAAHFHLILVGVQPFGEEK